MIILFIFLVCNTLSQIDRLKHYYFSNPCLVVVDFYKNQLSSLKFSIHLQYQTLLFFLRYQHCAVFIVNFYVESSSHNNAKIDQQLNYLLISFLLNGFPQNEIFLFSAFQMLIVLFLLIISFFSIRYTMLEPAVTLE